MTKARDAVNAKPKAEPSKWWSWSLSKLSEGKDLWIFGLGWAKFLGWMVVTTGMITALPLTFEIKREYILDEEESRLIASGISEGRTPQELAMNGLTAAVDPKVLN